MSEGITFNLSEREEMLRDAAREFAVEVIRPAASHHDSTGEYAWDVLTQAWEAGLMNVHVPEEFGGLGASHVEGILIAEELAWGCSGIGTAMEANGLSQAPILVSGDKFLIEKYLAPQVADLKDGRPIMAAYAVTEPGAGSDVSSLKTTAVRDGDNWILNGNKMWITNAGVADWYFVVAYTDQSAGYKGMTAFIVERKWEGVSVGGKEHNMGQRASDTRSLTFENVVVPHENVVGQVGMGWMLAMNAFDHTRPAVSAAAVGVARAAFEYAKGYSLERRTFGKPIAKHQAIQFKLAEMAMNIEAGRLLCWQAAAKKDAGLQNTMHASMAKAFCADMAMQITTDAVQIYGGYGYSQEYPVEKLMRDAKIFQIYEGTSQIQRMIIARELFKQR
jgi:acyl-CoA dehydrogenase